MVIHLKKSYSINIDHRWWWRWFTEKTGRSSQKDHWRFVRGSYFFKLFLGPVGLEIVDHGK